MSQPITGLSDIHRHLDGSLRPSTVAELAAGLGVVVPDDLLFAPGMSLQAALSKFAFTVSLLQSPESLSRVAHEICEDAEADGVETLEVRFAPQLHAPEHLASAVDAVLNGLAGRAGLVLCCLYGEPPPLLEALVEIGRTRMGVVGIDLAGAPTPAHRFRLLDYQPGFRTAAGVGLGRTVHAGEGRPPGEIGTAVSALGAQRIGHGTTLLEDPNVLDCVVRNQIVIEACVTSNVHTGVVQQRSDHPLPTWLAHGVKATLCTDNTLLSAVQSSTEQDLVAEALGLDIKTLDQLNTTGHSSAFRRG